MLSVVRPPVLSLSVSTRFHSLPRLVNEHSDSTCNYWLSSLSHVLSDQTLCSYMKPFISHVTSETCFCTQPEDSLFCLLFSRKLLLFFFLFLSHVSLTRLNGISLGVKTFSQHRNASEKLHAQRKKQNCKPGRTQGVLMHDEEIDVLNEVMKLVCK